MRSPFDYTNGERSRGTVGARILRGERMRMPDSAAIHEGPILATAFDEASAGFYSASVEGAVVFRDRATGSVLRRWTAHRGPVTDLAFDARHRQLITAGHDQTIGVWEATSGAPVS